MGQVSSLLDGQFRFENFERTQDVVAKLLNQSVEVGNQALQLFPSQWSLISVLHEISERAFSEMLADSVLPVSSRGRSWRLRPLCVEQT